MQGHTIFSDQVYNDWKVEAEFPAMQLSGNSCIRPLPES